ELGEGVFEVKAVNGNTWLGGDDYDDRIMDYLVTEFQKEHGIDLRKDKVALQRLKEAAEKAKIELSSVSITDIKLPFLVTDGDDSKHLDITLTREKLEELTVDLLQKMVGPTRQALADAELEPDDIDRVVLVGGATRMPSVQRLIKELIGKEPYKDINPDEVVAIGAAIQAGILAGEVRKAVLVDVTPLSLGIETQGGIFAKIIERNTTIPTSCGQIFTTAADNQTEVDIHVLQGEREMAMYNMSLGRFQLVGIPPAPRGMPQIEVTFDIDADGIVHVSAKDLHTEKEQSMRITSPKALSEEEIKWMIEEAQAYAEEDRKQREEVEIRIQADSMIHAAQMTMEEAARRLDETKVEEIEKAILKVKTALANDDSQE
ncbi:molecular chaperone DnaK, partial [Candidatus Hakubella thermalkaliphila]